ncbi:hypothetical protein JHK87_004157 [Glycine soja]|nr:hypothetical protein JHK87_004157 [Glycine soja]
MGFIGLVMWSGVRGLMKERIRRAQRVFEGVVPTQGFYLAKGRLVFGILKHGQVSFQILTRSFLIPKLLADEVVFLALKVSVAMGYLAPEYITTRCFTEKRDIYTFGVIILHVLSGKMTIGSSIQTTVESYGGKNTFKACNTVYS